jgi:hypothetical protein
MANYDKIQNLAYWLNYHAYIQQQGKQPRRPIKQFSPCPRSTIVIQGQRDQRPLFDILNEAYLEFCTCHSSITIDDMFNYCYDDRAKVAHGRQLDPSIL